MSRRLTAQSAKLFAALENPVMTDLVVELAQRRERSVSFAPCPIFIPASR
jgi:hypothetical protein